MFMLKQIKNSSFHVMVTKRSVGTQTLIIKKLSVPLCLYSVLLCGKKAELGCLHSGSLENFFLTKLDLGASQSEQQ